MSYFHNRKISKKITPGILNKGYVLSLLGLDIDTIQKYSKYRKYQKYRYH